MGSPAKLEAILRDKFKITNNQYGIQSVRCCGGVYNNVALELSDYILGDWQIKWLFEAMNESGAKGFLMTPRGERESQARHYILFNF
jgi:hypothetical protein